MNSPKTFTESIRRWSSVYGVILATLVWAPVSHAQQENRPDFEATYLTTLITFDDPRWRIEDHLCDVDCSEVAFEYGQSLLADPRNNDRSLKELQGDVKQYNTDYIKSLFTHAAVETTSTFDQANDPVLQCEPVRLLRQVTSPLPLKIEQHDDRIIFRYEYWDTVRTIYMDGRTHPPNLAPSRLGHSIGWYDGSTLVVETAGIEPGIFASLAVDGLRNTRHALGIERYTRNGDGRLDLELTVVDPRILRQPLILKRSWLSVPDMEFQEFVCDAVSGEF